MSWRGNRGQLIGLLQPAQLLLRQVSLEEQLRLCRVSAGIKAIRTEGRELSLFASLQWGQFSAILTLSLHRCLQQKKQITQRSSLKFSSVNAHNASCQETRKFDSLDATLTASLAWFLARAKSRWFPLVIIPLARLQFKPAF